MVSIADHARVNGDHLAAVVGDTGETLTYRELDERSMRTAQLLAHRGLHPGDAFAVLLTNRLEYFELLWAAIRSGLYITTLNTHLTPAELRYILADCGAKALFTSADLQDLATEAAAGAAGCRALYNVDGAHGDFDDYVTSRDSAPASPIATLRGDFLLYSSGTTGQPKGIKRQLSGDDVSTPPLIVGLVQLLMGVDESSVYLSAAPLYHTAPLGWALAAHYLGATVVTMTRFDPTTALEAIERHAVTHSQWVPTMFVRMLNLEPEERNRFDLSSMHAAIHAAAPCPIPTKREMLAWWGPIIHEYYGGTEGCGFCYVSPEEWLAHPGTVGRSMIGQLRICDDSGNEQPVGADGLVYFERDEMPFEYLGDPDKTRDAQHPAHPTWSTMGDIGHVDEDGFLYLTDRRSFVIISGGVNVYPQEIENVLVTHPAVEDAGVIGIPDDDMGEKVMAVVQLRPEEEATDDLAAELAAHCREHLAGFKVPRRFEFSPTLPREPNGKLYKQKLRAQYAIR